MKTRIRSIFVVFSILTAAGPAAADAIGGRGSVESLPAPGEPSQSQLDRRLAIAMARMDENLLALLGPATLDCAGEFVETGMETCVARLDGARRYAGPLSD